MVDGLRERERVRDLFGRHVGREVAAAAEARPAEAGRRRTPCRSRLRRHHRLDAVGDQAGPPAEVVDTAEPLLRGRSSRRSTATAGFVNKFEGDACAGGVRRAEPPRAPRGRGAGRRRAPSPSGSAPRCRSAKPASAWPQVRWSPATSAPRNGSSTRSSASRSTRPRGCASWPRRSPSRLLASSDAVQGASESERAHWTFGDTVTLRGHDEPTLLAVPV